MKPLSKRRNPARTSAWLAAFALTGMASPALLPPSTARAGLGESIGISPWIDWLEIETDHFRVSVPRSLKPIGERAAAQLEEFHSTLAAQLQWTPAAKTRIVLVDNTDAANGLATPVARIGIFCYLSPPDSWSAINRTDDWLRMVLLHEYSHILNMDPTRGWWADLRLLLGDLPLPNTTWRTWMLEGLATWNETRFTNAGRGRSPYWRALLRAAVRDGVLGSPRFVSIDRLEGEVPEFPGGEIRYLFGYELWNQLLRDAHDANGDTMGRISADSSDGIPYWINRYSKRAVARSWNAVWKDWLAEKERVMRSELAKIRERPVTKLRELTREHDDIRGISSSNDGKWVAYLAENSDHRPGLYLLDRASEKISRLADNIQGASTAFTPDSSAILYSGLEQSGVYDSFSELLLWDLAAGTRSQLTMRLRAKDPDIAPNGTDVAFATTHEGTVSLSTGKLVRDNEGEWSLEEVKVRFTPSPLSRIAQPKFAPDGRRIVFSLKENGRTSEEIVEFDTTTGETRTLVDDGNYNVFPGYRPDGSLLYVSDRGGVENIRVLRGGETANGAWKKDSLDLTNTETALYFPHQTRDGALYASQLSSEGWNLAVAPQGLPEPARSALAPALPPPPAPSAAPMAAASAKSGSEFPAREYSPWQSLIPRQWSPVLDIGEYSGWLGGNFLGFDALDLHRYVASIGVDSTVLKPDYSLTLETRNFGPTFSLGLSDSTILRQYYTDHSLAFFSREASTSLRSSWLLPGTWSQLLPSIGLSLDWERDFSRLADGSDDLLYSGGVPVIDATVTYGNLVGSELAISAEGGWSAQAGMLGFGLAEGWSAKGIAGATKYWGLPDHWVATTSLRGSYTTRTTAEYAAANARTADASARRRGFDLTRMLVGGSGRISDAVYVRGYPGLLVYSRGNLVGSAELRFPISRIFRGYDLFPAFLKNLSGFAFTDAAQIYGTTEIATLPAAGVGLQLTGTLFVRAPLQATIEYHYGTNKDFAGRGNFVATLNIGGATF